MIPPLDNIGDGEDNIDHPTYELIAENDGNGHVVLIAKSIYGNYEAINKYPMNPVSAAVLAYLILREALLATNAIEEETQGDDSEEEDEG